VPSISIVSPPFVAALIFLTVAAWAIVRRVRRDPRRRWATGAVVAASLVTIAAILTVVNAYFAYLPKFGDVTNVVAAERNWPDYQQIASVRPADAARRWPHGVTVHLDIPDRGSGFGSTTALVYLPVQYFADPGERFPVAYLFHGSPGVPGDWFRGGEAPAEAERLAKAGHPLIVVAPRMSHHWLDDPECVDGVTDKVETHLLRDVIPTVDTTLRSIGDRTGRIFGGMSAGGYCALNLGLRNRQIVSTILDFSGFTKPTHAGGLTKLFGPASPATAALIAANSPDRYAPTLPEQPLTRIWLDSGTEDGGVAKQMTPLAATLRAGGLSVEWRERPGAHTFQVWVPALQEALPWALGLPPGNAPENPSRPGPSLVVSAHR
jgi:enterochelin esterase-like enzyme